MENLMMSIIAGVIASYIYDKLKSHSERPTELYPLFYTVKKCKSSYKVLVSLISTFLLY